jgi:hypothetical protein
MPEGGIVSNYFALIVLQFAAIAVIRWKIAVKLM